MDRIDNLGLGSSLRAVATAGIFAYRPGAVPLAGADTLRRFVLSPVHGALLHAKRRPSPSDTYHTNGDASSALDPRAFALVARTLSAIVAELG